MPNPALHGNGYDCPACALRRESDPWQRGEHPCNNCNGSGRIAFSLRETYERQLADAREFYWRHKVYA